jgi:hypothetical protein
MMGLSAFANEEITVNHSTARQAIGAAERNNQPHIHFRKQIHKLNTMNTSDQNSGCYSALNGIRLIDRQQAVQFYAG